jgi:drug/metabolite transporter (DMT)-like permease
MRYLPAVIVDALLVLVFAAIGRASHDESPAGFLLTAWPFLVALLLGHLLAALLPARPRRPWSLLWGLVVWVVTVVGGMLLRVLSGDTAQVPFIIVATLTLGVFLVGWRGITALVRRSRSRAASTHDVIADDASTDVAPGDVAPDETAPDETAPDDVAPTRRDDDPVA